MAEHFMTDRRIAAGYADDRPFLHGQVLETALADLPGGERFRHGLDVGCGAGLSVRALLPYCRRVTGTDICADMIAEAASRCPGSVCTFRQCSAEELGCLEDVYDIVTAAGVTDWIDTGRFLAGLAQVVRDGSILLVYDFWITDRMEGTPAYTKWWHEQYLQKFPRPDRAPGAEDKSAEYGFMLQKQDSVKITHPFGKEALIRFLMLQSNVNACIGEGGKRAEEAGRWMARTLQPVFYDRREYGEQAHRCGEEKILLFDGYYRRYVYHGSKKDS